LNITSNKTCGLKVATGLARQGGLKGIFLFVKISFVNNINMPEEKNDAASQADNHEEFKNLLEKTEIKLPIAGDLIKGVVITASKAEVRLDIDGILTGVVRGPELYQEDDDYANLKPGDEVEATVIERENENGELELSFRYAGQDKAWGGLREAFDKKENLKVKEVFIENERYILVDLFGGEKDIKNKIIRAVGEPADRFKEDALRLMRAIRFSCQLGFEIEPKTERAIVKMAGGLKFVAQERIQAEMVKILETDKAYDGIMLLHHDKLLQYIIPELERGVGVEQNRHHIYTVFKHSVLSLKFCPSKDWRVKFASLLHDIAKPITKDLKNGDATFYNHDIVGAKIAKKIMLRMKFSTADLEKVTNLIRNHMFYYNVGEVTESSVRRLIRKVGYENLKDLIDLRIADRLGSGVPKAKPYKLRHLEYMMEKVQTDPVSVKMLKINGDDLMKILAMEPGPKIGAILDVLLSEVIDNPSLNTTEILETKVQELNKLDIIELRERAKEKIEEKKMEDDEELKKGHWVK